MIKTSENKLKIIAYITKNGVSKSADIAELLQLSRDRARVLLSELVAEGKLSAEGERRSRLYVLNTNEQNTKKQ